MMMMMGSSLNCIIIVSSLLLFSYIAKATVPSSKTFTLVNSGVPSGFVDGEVSYCIHLNEKASNKPFNKLSNHPFSLCFYAPNPAIEKEQTAFTLAILLDDRLVWIAKQTRPVIGLNATLTFGRQGNLVLADGYRRVVWQTRTANKDVVDIKLLPNGNMVLLDSHGRFVWQSFDYPTDVLLSGQSIRANGVSKLVSRMSASDPSPGPYSLEIDGNGMSFYYSTKHSKEIYSRMDSFTIGSGKTLTKMTFESKPADYTKLLTYVLSLAFTVDNSTTTFSPPGAQPKFNATYSFVKLEQDGNLRFYTYMDGYSPVQWEETYTVFARNKPRESSHESECKLPEKCGAFGLCQYDQCVACPTLKGLMGWSYSCEPPKLPPCHVSTPANKVNYYKMVGVDHFSSNYAGVTMKQVECRNKCSQECNCKAYFYRTAESKCLLTSVLNTLTEVSDSTHLAFIKISS